MVFDEEDTFHHELSDYYLIQSTVLHIPVLDLLFVESQSWELNHVSVFSPYTSPYSINNDDPNNDDEDDVPSFFLLPLHSIFILGRDQQHREHSCRAIKKTTFHKLLCCEIESQLILHQCPAMVTAKAFK